MTYLQSLCESTLSSNVENIEGLIVPIEGLLVLELWVKLPLDTGAIGLPKTFQILNPDESRLPKKLAQVSQTLRRHYGSENLACKLAT